MNRPSVYEHAGGDQAFLRLARAHNARCLADPELNHPFSHGGHPQHVERLAAYWAEVFGGPALFSEQCNTQSDVLEMHSSTAAPAEWGQRFVDCFVAAMDDAELPDDPEFRGVLHSYMQWATRDFATYFPKGSIVPTDVAVPRWGWDGLTDRS